MRRSRLGAFGAICAFVAVGAAATGIATAAATPSASAVQSLVAGSPSAIACGGSVDATVTVTGQPGTTGQSTDVMLVLDLSGSTGTPPSKLANLESAATDTLAALDAADGTDRSVDRRQRRGHRLLPGLGGHGRRADRLELQHVAVRDRPPARAVGRQPAQPRHQRGEQRARRQRQRVREVDGADQRRPGERRRPDERDERRDRCEDGRHPHRAARPRHRDRRQPGEPVEPGRRRRATTRPPRPARSAAPSSSPISAPPSRRP